MGVRGVGRSVVKGASAVAVGIALGMALDRAWVRGAHELTTDGVRAERARAIEAPLAAHPVAAPEHAESPPRDPVSMEANRDDATLAASDDTAELARLRERVKELESQVARLEAIVAANDPRTKRIREVFALNDLRHGALYREIAELAFGDPESIADDPRKMCALLIRLIDETGLLAAPFADEHRDLQPEPEAPEVRLSLYSGTQSYTTTIDDVESPVTSEQATLNFSIELPKMPEHWLGRPLSMNVRWTVEEDSIHRGSMQLEIEDPTRSPLNGLQQAVSWSLHENLDSVNFGRSPIRGGEENVEGGPHDLADERRIVDELSEKLRVRARG